VISVHSFFFSVYIENTMSEVSTPLIEKKPFPEDRAIKLAMAREKALEVRRKNSVIRKKAELEKMESKMNPTQTIPETVPEPVPDRSTSEQEPPQEEPEPAPSPPKVAPLKTKKQKRQMVVVEQSSDDSDEFQPNQSVVFVKRVRKKKPPSPPPPPQREPSPPRAVERSSNATPQPPHNDQLHAQHMYNTMFGGHFLSGGRRR
jgi:hypothetical protein